MRISFIHHVELNIFILPAPGEGCRSVMIHSDVSVYILRSICFWLSHVSPGRFQHAGNVVRPGSQTLATVPTCLGCASCVEFNPLSLIDIAEISSLAHGVFAALKDGRNTTHDEIRTH